jgi:hypothetical protein
VVRAEIVDPKRDFDLGLVLVQAAVEAPLDLGALTVHGGAVSTRGVGRGIANSQG